MQNKQGHDQGLKPSDILFEERRARIDAKGREAEIEDRDDMAMGMKMDQLDLSIRPDGRRTNSNRTKKKSSKDSSFKDNSISFLGAAIEATKSALGSAVSIAGAFATTTATMEKAKDIQNIYRAEDETYVYDTIAVSMATAIALNAEADHLAELVQEIREEKDPAKITRLQMELNDIANYYSMRPHPVTGLYVHCYDYITKIESIHNPHQMLKADGFVNYFIAKADIATSRGVKRAIADVYDQNPEEVQLTQSDTAVQIAAKPVPPTLIHS